jgi:hypothetical protein
MDILQAEALISPTQYPYLTNTWLVAKQKISLGMEE